jgi:hypothetical protein
LAGAAQRPKKIFSHFAHQDDMHSMTEYPIIAGFEAEGVATLLLLLVLFLLSLRVPWGREEAARSEREAPVPQRLSTTLSGSMLR